MSLVLFSKGSQSVAAVQLYDPNASKYYPNPIFAIKKGSSLKTGGWDNL